MKLTLSKRHSKICWMPYVYYESKETGLGVRFRNVFADLAIFVGKNPKIWRLREGGYYRVNFSVFPYYLAYVIRDEVAVIVAIANSHRKPGFWHERL